ncbi:MAG TPA: MFS transporter [Alphaproteobacteria bacterium]
MTGDRPAPSRQSLRGLDGLNFFLANVQTGFGPFIAVYLTAAKWTQVEIGIVLTVAGMASLFAQIPGGALVDAARSKLLVGGLAIATVGVSAVMLAAAPIFPLVLLAEVLHSLASAVIGPVIATISLGLVGRHAIGERLGRNACFASIGNGIAAAVMGAFGRLVSTRSVFIVTAVLAIPALLCLRMINPKEIDPERAIGGRPPPVDRGSNRKLSVLHGLIDNKPLLIFGGCLALFHLANGALLPLMGSMVTMRSPEWATTLIAACIVVPQIVVAALSPSVGREAERRGRRILLLIGFGALVIRGVLFSFIISPWVLVVVQILDGISGAVLGVLVPLIVADTTRGTGHFNAALGVVGTMVGVGASFSSTLGGYVSDVFGGPAAFLSLAAVAGLGFLAVLSFMPETRPPDDEPA